jgi:hypothetical protein
MKLKNIKNRRFLEPSRRLEGIELIDLAIYIKKSKTLIITDTHIGYEESLNKQGVLIPKFHFKDTIQRLEKIFSKVRPEIVIINGDVKDEFGTISETEWRNTLQLLDFLLKYCKEVVLIKGNHDKIIGPIAKKRNVKVVDEFLIDDILILHGDKIPDELLRCKTIIIGHEHPAVGLKEGTRKEVFKCFLVGKWEGKTLIVQPSFNLVVEGTDVLKEDLLSPFLTNIDNFRCYVVGDKLYDFGKIKKLK